jgi:hypothetical protein
MTRVKLTPEERRERARLRSERWRRLARRFRCIDCGKDTKDGEYYLVKDELWAASGGGDGMLCLACLERRIGRELTLADFTWPSTDMRDWTLEAWERHVASRGRQCPDPD